MSTTAAPAAPPQRWSIRNSLEHEAGTVETHGEATEAEALAAYAAETRAPLAELSRIGYTARPA